MSKTGKKPIETKWMEKNFFGRCHCSRATLTNIDKDNRATIEWFDFNDNNFANESTLSSVFSFSNVTFFRGSSRSLTRRKISVDIVRRKCSWRTGDSLQLPAHGNNNSNDRVQIVGHRTTMLPDNYDAHGSHQTGRIHGILAQVMDTSRQLVQLPKIKKKNNVRRQFWQSRREQIARNEIGLLCFGVIT